MAIKTRKRKKRKFFSRKPQKFRYGNYKRKTRQKFNKTGKKKKKRRFSKKYNRSMRGGMKRDSAKVYDEGSGEGDGNPKRLRKAAMKAEEGVPMEDEEAAEAEDAEDAEPMEDEEAAAREAAAHAAAVAKAAAVQEIALLLKEGKQIMIDNSDDIWGRPTTRGSKNNMENKVTVFLKKLADRYEISGIAILKLYIFSMGNLEKTIQRANNYGTIVMSDVKPTDEFTMDLDKFTMDLLIKYETPIIETEMMAIYEQLLKFSELAEKEKAAKEVMEGLLDQCNMWLSCVVGAAGEKVVDTKNTKEALYIYVNMFESIEVAYLYWLGYNKRVSAALFAYLLKLPLPQKIFDSEGDVNKNILNITSGFQYDTLPKYESIKINKAYNICIQNNKLAGVLGWSNISEESKRECTPPSVVFVEPCSELSTANILKSPIKTVVNLAIQQSAADIYVESVRENHAAAKAKAKKKGGTNLEDYVKSTFPPPPEHAADYNTQFWRKIKNLIIFAAMRINNYELIADLGHDDTLSKGDRAYRDFGFDVNPDAGALGSKYPDDKWCGGSIENHMLDNEIERIKKDAQADHRGEVSAGGNLQNLYQYASASRDRAFLQRGQFTDYGEQVDWHHVRSDMGSGADVSKDRGEAEAQQAARDAAVEKFREEVENLTTTSVPDINFIIDVKSKLFDGLPYSEGICFTPFTRKDFSNIIDPAKSKVQSLFKCDILLTFLWEGDNDKGPWESQSGSTEDGGDEVIMLNEAQIMFKLCTVFMENIPFCESGESYFDLKGENGLQYNPDDFTNMDAFVGAVEILNMIEVIGFAIVSSVENADIKCKFNPDDAPAAAEAAKAARADAEAEGADATAADAAEKGEFIWQASQSQMCGIINIYIEDFNLPARGVKESKARSEASVESDILAVFNLIYHYVFFIRNKKAPNVKKASEDAAMVVVMLARIMKYMGDKSHVICALVYNYISQKPFCVCTIDRPLISTIMKLIYSGNFLSNNLPEKARIVTKWKERIDGEPPEEGEEDLIINALKNLGVGAAPYVTASYMLEHLPGFYGRFLEGVAHGGWTLWIYGPNVNNKKAQLIDRITDIKKMCTNAKELWEGAAAVAEAEAAEAALVEAGDPRADPLKSKALADAARAAREAFEPHALPDGPSPDGKTWSYALGNWQNEGWLEGLQDKNPTVATTRAKATAAAAAEAEALRRLALAEEEEDGVGAREEKEEEKAVTIGDFNEFKLVDTLGEGWADVLEANNEHLHLMREDEFSKLGDLIFGSDWNLDELWALLGEGAGEEWQPKDSRPLEAKRQEESAAAAEATAAAARAATAAARAHLRRATAAAAAVAVVRKKKKASFIDYNFFGKFFKNFPVYWKGGMKPEWAPKSTNLLSGIPSKTTLYIKNFFYEILMKMNTGKKMVFGKPRNQWIEFAKKIRINSGLFSDSLDWRVALWQLIGNDKYDYINSPGFNNIFRGVEGKRGDLRIRINDYVMDLTNFAFILYDIEMATTEEELDFGDLFGDREDYSDEIVDLRTAWLEKRPSIKLKAGGAEAGGDDEGGDDEGGDDEGGGAGAKE